MQPWVPQLTKHHHAGNPFVFVVKVSYGVGRNSYSVVYCELCGVICVVIYDWGGGQGRRDSKKVSGSGVSHTGGQEGTHLQITNWIYVDCNFYT